jgi:hypothetical protein
MWSEIVNQDYMCSDNINCEKLYRIQKLFIAFMTQ